MDDKAREKIIDILDKPIEVVDYRTVKYISEDSQIELADQILALVPSKLPEGEPPSCENCLYKQRYIPSQLYDDDFGRITGTKRPRGSEY